MKNGTVLVTGAAVRIGRAIVLELVAGGWRVAIHCNRNAVQAEALAAEIAALGGTACAVAADLADEDATTALVSRAASELGPVTALVNNASLFEHDTPWTVSRAGWDTQMAVNLRAPFVLTQALLDHLGPGGRGAVVNIVDQRVWNPGPEFTTYTLSKMALWDMTRVLARALAPNVRVNAVGPGPTLANSRQSADQFARQWQATPLGRPVDPTEVAAAVRFLLDAPAVTGQMIAVDSGQHLGFADDSHDIPGQG